MNKKNDKVGKKVDVKKDDVKKSSSIKKRRKLIRILHQVSHTCIQLLIIQ